MRICRADRQATHLTTDTHWRNFIPMNKENHVIFFESYDAHVSREAEVKAVEALARSNRSLL